MNYDDKCFAMAKYVVDRMSMDQLIENAINNIYQQLKRSDMLEDFMENYEVTNEDLNKFYNN